MLLAQRHGLRALVRKYAQSDEDKALYEALSHNDVQHVAQAIRQTKSGEVEFQHLTLRCGERSEQSVHQLELSTEFKYALDLFSLYLALRYCRFQLDTYHPELVNKVVLPLNIDALTWAPGNRVLQQMIRADAEAFAYIIPSLILGEAPEASAANANVIATLRAYVETLCYDIHLPFQAMTFLQSHQPDMLKISLSIDDQTQRAALLPLMRFLRSHPLPWIAGRVTSQKELNQYSALGSSYYFGYFSDLPTSISFRSFETYT
ncbi:diguanylate phosphodiesterase [Vibrio sp. SM6]|uniref:Diguanylate phosphodiesterase n=2 Tax=Vibrio agarilyticus TaxID=2726741 RepID=A0A7X8TSC5_9VIBR|nr:diguanylate phosphodiesterase [Vibrio agarilyticus]